MDYKMKKESFLEALKKLDILRIFEVLEDTDDELILQSVQHIDDESACVITVRLGENYFNTAHFILCEFRGKDKESHENLKEIILNLLNELNKKTFFFNYYLDSHGDKETIVARTTYITSNENFVGSEFAEMIISAFASLSESFRGIMEVLNYSKNL